MKNKVKSKALSKLKDIAKYLEEAGFVEHAKCVNDAMCAIDGLEDNLDDNIRPDSQYNTGGPIGYSGEAGSASPGLFSIDEAEKLASLANTMDQKGLYVEANELDRMLREYTLEEEEALRNMPPLPDLTEEELEEMSWFYQNEDELKARKKKERQMQKKEVPTEDIEELISTESEQDEEGFDHYFPESQMFDIEEW